MKTMVIAGALALLAAAASAAPPALPSPPVAATKPYMVKGPVERQERASPQRPPATLTTGAVEITIEPGALKLPARVPSGTTTFAVQNLADEPHSFYVRGPGVSASLPQPVRPGETATLALNLAPGVYRVGCGLEGHPSLEAALTVE